MSAQNSWRVIRLNGDLGKGLSIISMMNKFGMYHLIALTGSLLLSAMSCGASILQEIDYRKRKK